MGTSILPKDSTTALRSVKKLQLAVQAAVHCAGNSALGLRRMLFFKFKVTL